MQSKATARPAHNNRSALRLVALVFCALFLAAALLSAAFLLTHANHTHGSNGSGGCLVCAQISVAKQLLRHAFTSAAMVLIGGALCFAVRRAPAGGISFRIPGKPVALKVRLNI